MASIKYIGSRMPRVLFTPEAKLRCDRIIAIGHEHNEVGWFGMVRKVGKDFLIDGIYIPGQEVRATTCEVKPDDLHAMAQELPEEQLGRVRAWFHSHVDMGVAASGTDDTQMKELSENVDDFFIRGIGNKRGQWSFAIFMYDMGLVIEDADWGITVDLNFAELDKDLGERINAKVRKCEYKGHQGSFSPHQVSNWRDPDHRSWREGGLGLDHGESLWRKEDTQPIKLPVSDDGPRVLKGHAESFSPDGAQSRWTREQRRKQALAMDKEEGKTIKAANDCYFKGGFA